MKALTFGFVIPVISVHMGFLTLGGGRGRGSIDDGFRRFHDHLRPCMDAMFPPLLLN